MRIDAHQHFWQYDPDRYSWIQDDSIKKDFTPSDNFPELQKNKVTGCVAVQSEQSEKETVRLLDLANRFDFIKGVVGWVDLTSKDAGDRLLHFKANSYFRGVRHTVWDTCGEFMVNREFQRGIACLAPLGLTYDILVFDYQLESAIDLVKAFPEQRFVLNHLGNPPMQAKVDPRWKQNIYALGSYSNVQCKISGLVSKVTDPNWKDEQFNPYLKVITESFGVDRIMFGSDWPVCLPAASYTQVFELVKNFYDHLSTHEKSQIFGLNAVEFYNLNTKVQKDYYHE